MNRILLAGCLLIATPAAYSRAASSAPSPAAPQPATPPGRFSGKVLETTNAATYTYVLVDTGSKKLWAAAPQFAVKAGDTVSISDGMPMANYHSKTLNRDFDVVYFTGNVMVNGARPAAAAAPGGNMPALPKNHPPIGGTDAQSDGMAGLPKNHPPIGGQSAQPKVDLKGIKKAEGGMTVAEVYLQKGKLKGQQVTVRGKVVKYNAGIMGKNWLHIRDGSGTEGNNDLLVTTATDAKVGDTVLVTGKLDTEKDFGAGYKYGVLLEDAKVRVE